MTKSFVLFLWQRPGETEAIKKVPYVTHALNHDALLFSPCKTIPTHRIFAGAIYISFWIFIATSIGRNDHNFRIKIRKMRFFCIPLNPNFRTPNWYPNFKFVLPLNQATHSGPSARFILAHNYSSKRTHILMSKLLRSAGWTKQNACNSRTPKVTYGTFSKTARAVTN